MQTDLTLESLKAMLGDYAKDAKINLSNLLSGELTPALSRDELYSVALSSALALNARNLVPVILQQAATTELTLSKEDLLAGAQAAVTSMAMTNVYYRFLHLAEHPGISSLPAGLRMQVLGKPPVDKKIFELSSLAVSTLAGCNSCIKAHIHELQKVGFKDEAIQATARIASVISAVTAAINCNLTEV